MTIIDELFSVISVVDPHPESYRLAGQLGYSLAKNGITMGVVDLLIAQLSIENGLKRLTIGNHFKVFKSTLNWNWYPYNSFRSP